ncbi:ABC transporter substrate-binding protein [Agromyces sp. ZXT2-3]|uniref:ABC transporter substrate-binding protein n=1 Tax=Agromyces sp. ZXT2-3 TaxID=3461152 RepID=UPI004054B71B
MTTMHRSGRRWAGVAIAAALAGSLAACAPAGNAADDDAGATADEIAAALQEESSITVWGWAPQLEPIVEAFEEKYPKVDVKLENVGTGNDHYTKLQNAIKAGTGAPDVAQVEYYALPQFALSGAFVDLTDFGAAELEDQYTASTWGSVSLNDGIYALPQDSGPMAMFYRADVFEDLGLDVPTTWDEYIEAGEAIHAANPDAYITNDVGDAGFTTSMIWQAGGQPYSVEGESDVIVDFGDEGSRTWANTWNELVQGDLVAPISSWSDEWYQGLADGSIATLVIGAWMPGNLESGVPDAAGKWRVAPMPTYEEGVAAAAENGGGGDAILEQSENKLVAYGFLEFLNGPEGAAIHAANGGFPSTVADLESDEFLDYESDYFGGQKINEVLVQASKDVVPGWSYLPFQTYANSIYGDTVGQAYASKSDLNEGLAAWQEATVEYGEEQGFTVNGR